MYSITINVTASEKQFLMKIAELDGKSLSELMRVTTLENLEDRSDAIAAKRAYEEYLADPVTVSHESLMFVHHLGEL
jgi:hypothetical protein